MPNYAVVTTYSFDDDVSVRLFDSEADAKRYLYNVFTEESRIDREENEWYTDAELFPNGDFAKIVNHFKDHDDVSVFQIVRPEYSTQNSHTKTLTAVEYDGKNFNTLSITFEVPDEDFDLVSALKEVAREYCRTAEGRKVYQKNNRTFNWGDILDIPRKFFVKHGLKLVEGNFGDTAVPWDEHIVDDSDVFDDEPVVAPQFVVTFSYSDGDNAAYLYDNEEKARCAMRGELENLAKETGSAPCISDSGLRGILIIEGDEGNVVRAAVTPIYQ